MQLIELETPSGKKVWVNPEQVITLTMAPNSNVATDLNLVDGHGKPVTVKGKLADVAKTFNAVLNGVTT
jgi:hypothetical protein